MHDNTWRAYGGPGRKGDTGDGGMQSYQATSEARGEAGYACDGRMRCAYGGAWGCMEAVES